MPTATACPASRVAVADGGDSASGQDGTTGDADFELFGRRGGTEGGQHDHLDCFEKPDEGSSRSHRISNAAP